MSSPSDTLKRIGVNVDAISIPKISRVFLLFQRIGRFLALLYREPEADLRPQIPSVLLEKSSTAMDFLKSSLSGLQNEYHFFYSLYTFLSHESTTKSGCILSSLCTQFSTDASSCFTYQ